MSSVICEIRPTDIGSRKIELLLTKVRDETASTTLDWIGAIRTYLTLNKSMEAHLIPLIYHTILQYGHGLAIGNIDSNVWSESDPVLFPPYAIYNKQMYKLRHEHYYKRNDVPMLEQERRLLEELSYRSGKCPGYYNFDDHPAIREELQAFEKQLLAIV